MIFKILLAFFCLLSITHYGLFAQQNAQEADQQISDFSLAGFGEQGKKSWDISGKTADIFGDIIKLKDVLGNLYGKEEDVKLTADRGEFDKAQGKVHLEQDVVIITSSGGKLTTESLDWDRKKQLITTQDRVNITKDNMVTIGQGIIGQTNLNLVTLQKDVRVDINPEVKEGKAPTEKDKTVITCDGPLEVDYAKNIAIFKDNVLVDTHDNLIYSDMMDVYFVPSKETEAKTQAAEQSSMLMGTQIDKIICRGNVKIIHGENVSYSDEATYLASDKKIILTGKPKLIIYSTEEIGASLGN